MRLSVLDTAPIVDGSTARQALRNTVDLAVLADQLGYRRYWVAEHHGMKGVASCATSVIVSEVACVTRRIRVGAGGVLLPNHPPLLIAEQYGTLEALHPGRIDLGLGRALGGPKRVAKLIRPEHAHTAGDFRGQVEELLRYFHAASPEGAAAVPAIGNTPVVWMLGSSSASAALAGTLGLPYAFAAHLNPAEAVAAVREYRARCGVKRDDASPYVALSVPVIAAETDSRAAWIAGSIRLRLLKRSRGDRVLLPSPEVAAKYSYTTDDKAQISKLTTGYIIGAAGSVHDQLQDLLDATTADELIITTPVFDHAARRESYEVLAEVGAQLEFGRLSQASESPAGTG